MSRLVLTQITIKKERSISSTTWYYLLQPSNASAPDPTNYGNPPPIYTTTGYSGWSTTEPTYTVGDDRVLYVMVQTLYSDGTFSYSTPSISSSYEAAKDAYNEIIQAETTIEQFEELGLKKGYIWDNETYVPASGSIPVYPIGTYVASGTLVNGQRSITRSNSNTYGLNTWISTGGINLRYNAIDLMKLTTSNLEFYYPSTSSQQKKAISLGTNGAVNSLAFYGFNSDNKTMELTNNGLHFYNPSNGSTELASFTTNGLVLSKGGVKAGTAGQSGFIYLSTENYGSNLTINSHQASNWREIIGTKFGVDVDGNLYASNAEISGKITATSGAIAGWRIESSYLASNDATAPAANVLLLSPSGTTSSYTIAGQAKTGWMITAGTTFGVNKDGGVYATSGKIGGSNITASSLYGNTRSAYNSGNGYYLGSDGKFGVGTTSNYLTFDGTNVNIKGGITATSLTIDSGATVSGVVVPSDISDMATKTQTDWSVIVTTTGTPNFTTPSVTLKATVYHRGTIATTGFTRAWYKNGTGNSLGSGETITVTDIDAYYVCIISES